MHVKKMGKELAGGYVGKTCVAMFQSFDADLVDGFPAIAVSKLHQHCDTITMHGGLQHVVW
jgi:hypothetical protein